MDISSQSSTSVTAMTATGDYMTAPPLTLVTAARRAGVHFHLSDTDTNYGKRGDLRIWSHREQEHMPIVAAMRARRAEIAAFLLEGRPAPPPVSAAEERYRRDVLHEPDILVSELRWPELMAMIVGVVYDTVQAIEDERAWEEKTKERDDPPRRATRTVRL